MSLTITTEIPPLVTDENGSIRVGKTRVTLETVVISYLAGYTLEEIVTQFPSLLLADVYSVVGYYLHHQAEIDQYLEDVAQASDRIRQEMEAKFSSTGIKERLLARQN